MSAIRFSRRYTVALVVALSLSTPAWAVSSPAATTSASAAAAAITIDNFGQIDPTYYRGAQPNGHDYANLAALGVKTIIDLTKDGDAAEPSLAQAAGMHFFRIPMTTRIIPTADQIAEFLKIATDPANQPVYVHCQGGRHRTGVMTAIYRMTKDQWTPAQAFAEMKKYKFGADFLHPEFKDFVFGYHTVAAAEPVVQSTTR